MPTYADPDKNREYMRLYMQRKRAEAKAKAPHKPQSPEADNLLARTMGKPGKLQAPNNDDLRAIGEFEKPPTAAAEAEVETRQPLSLWLIIALAAAIVFCASALIHRFL